MGMILNGDDDDHAYGSLGEDRAEILARFEQARLKQEERMRANLESAEGKTARAAYDAMSYAERAAAIRDAAQATHTGRFVSEFGIKIPETQPSLAQETQALIQQAQPTNPEDAIERTMRMLSQLEDAARQAREGLGDVARIVREMGETNPLVKAVSEPIVKSIELTSAAGTSVEDFNPFKLTVVSPDLSSARLGKSLLEQTTEAQEEEERVSRRKTVRAFAEAWRTLGEGKIVPLTRLAAIVRSLKADDQFAVFFDGLRRGSKLQTEALGAFLDGVGREDLARLGFEYTAHQYIPDEGRDPETGKRLSAKPIFKGYELRHLRN